MVSRRRARRLVFLVLLGSTVACGVPELSRATHPEARCPAPLAPDAPTGPSDWLELELGEERIDRVGRGTVLVRETRVEGLPSWPDGYPLVVAGRGYRIGPLGPGLYTITVRARFPDAIPESCPNWRYELRHWPLPFTGSGWRVALPDDGWRSYDGTVIYEAVYHRLTSPCGNQTTIALRRPGSLRFVVFEGRTYRRPFEPLREDCGEYIVSVRGGPPFCPQASDSGASEP